MKDREYSIMASIEDHFWWFVALRKLYKHLLGNQRDLTLLDAGCGTGANLRMLSTYGTAYGIDYSPLALSYTRRKTTSPLFLGSITALPFKNETFDVVLASDVVYHQWVNDADALQEVYRVLKKNGILLLNTASYNFMKSSHDTAVMTKTRYTKKRLSSLLRKNNFKIRRIFYWNSLLFPALFVNRLFPKKESDLQELSPFVNNVLLSILNFELFFIKKGISLPFGLSLMCKAQKL